MPTRLRLGADPVDTVDEHEPAVPSFTSLIAVSIGRVLLAAVLVGFVVVTLRRLL